MKGFDKVVDEIRKTVAQILIIPSLLNGIIVFLIAYLILSFFDFYPEYAIVIAALYTGYLIWKELGINKLKLVERYYPSLNEKLRTAADYADKEDVMVNALHKEVIEEIKSVATSAFISRRDITIKTMVIFGVCFVLLGITYFHLDSKQFKSGLEDQINKLAQKVLAREGNSIFSANKTNTSGAGGGSGVGINTDIFGDKKLAILGDEQLDVEIKPSTMEFKIGEVKEAEKKDFEQVFPGEIYIKAATTSEDKIPKEKQELVKNYFKKIATETR